MFKVEIKAADVAAKDYDFQNDRGERVSGTKRSQAGFIHLPGKPYPIEVEIKLQGQQVPYQPGEYKVSPDSFRVYQGKLQLMRLLLAPVRAAA